MSLDILSFLSLSPATEPGKTILADAAYGNGASSGFDFSIPPTPYDSFPPLLAPSMTSIFPTFSYPDVNFFIWLFGARYRHLVARWNDRLSHLRPLTPGSLPGAVNRQGALQNSPHVGRVNFAGMALNQVGGDKRQFRVLTDTFDQFYAAVRKALVLAILLRATVLLGSVSAAVLWLSRRLRKRAKL